MYFYGFLIAFLVAMSSPTLGQESKPDATKFQGSKLSKEKQIEDFDICVTGAKEGFSGLYYYQPKPVFTHKCDSVRATLTSDASSNSFYLKLRYLLASARHGHASLNLNKKQTISFSMATLHPERHYIPMQLICSNGKLFVVRDASKENIIPQGAQIESINGISAASLLAKMLPLMPADGNNISYKYYCLGEKYQFHFLYQMLYPDVTHYILKIAGQKKRIKRIGLLPQAIKETLAGKSALPEFTDPLVYKPVVRAGVAYLKVQSFYSGFIRNFGHRTGRFLDSAFVDMAARQTQTLLLDLRGNEGGGEALNDTLFAHLTQEPFTADGTARVAGRVFTSSKYGFDLREDLQAFINQPSAFLRDDTSLLLKPEFSETKQIKPLEPGFAGRLLVLTDGGTFSAASIMVSYLYQNRNTRKNPVIFIGEEAGGDIYSQVMCAGVGYNLRLPNSLFEMSVPGICTGTLNLTPPLKRLPDISIANNSKDIANGTDTVLEAALRIATRP